MRYRRAGGERRSGVPHNRKVSHDASGQTGRDAMAWTMAGVAPAMAGEAIGNVRCLAASICRSRVDSCRDGYGPLDAEGRSEHAKATFFRSLTGSGENKQPQDE